jgi:Heterokaryon incompatibility protein (HET)
MGSGRSHFEDLSSSRDVFSKKGFVKLKGFCDVVRSKNFDYAWCDTCCINKDSSTELDAALNTMYLWYSDAGLCIVYLEDVTPGGLSI